MNKNYYYYQKEIIIVIIISKVKRFGFINLYIK